MMTAPCFDPRNTRRMAIAITAFLGLFTAAASAAVADLDPVQSVLKHNDGICLSLAAGKLYLQALAPDVIRVRFSQTGEFPPQRVPVLLLNNPAPAFTVIKASNLVGLKVGNLTAVVDDTSGAVRFVDEAGRPVVAEAPGSRLLTPTTLQAPTPVASFKSADLFYLPPGESIYGLGQHQSDLLDYRGSVVTLEQTNREVAIPFLVSSRGYGLLWNNAAHTDVNVGSGGEAIPQAQLLDDSGKPGGLTGHYFTDEKLTTELYHQTDPGVDFDWSDTPPTGLTHDHYSVRWTGSVLAMSAGTYTFHTDADDGVRLWIDGQPAIDDWQVHPVTTDSASVRFDAGTSHSIRLEYFQEAGLASVRLYWSPPATNATVGWSSEAADDIDYTVFYGPAIDKLIAEYRRATGAAPLIPKWALGYWQSKERYNTQQEWLDIAAEYRERKDPIDNIVQDWFYWAPFPWGSDKFDPNRYPDPAAGIQTLHDQYHMHFMISVWGKFDPGTPDNPDANYDLMNAKGFLYLPLGPENASNPSHSVLYYDAFNPEARDLYWQIMRDSIFDKGVDAWWLDASEPEMDMQVLRQTPTAAGLGSLVLNGWPLMHTTGVSEGQLRDAPDKRVFILTRSAFAGQQRTGAATWSGDITASWDVLAAQIPAGLNFAMSGIPYWTTDIGAFFVNYPGGASNPEYRELYTRWFQFGAFCPLFRSHGTNTPREMWQFGPDVESVLLKYDNLRYRLMPYIYSQAWRVTNQGATIMRALVFDFPGDVTARECKDEFLFGPSILVCPVTKYQAVSRPVYLPAGTSWTDFWTGVHYRGGQTIDASAPIDKMPLFVRDGAILPMGPELQYVAEKPEDPIELRIYGGSSGAFTLFEDEGIGFGYKNHMYATIPIRWNAPTKTLVIGARSGAFPGMLRSRAFDIVWVRPGTGVGEQTSTSDKVLTYAGTRTVTKQPAN